MSTTGKLSQNLLTLNKNLQITAFFSMFECLRTEGYRFLGEAHDFWECVYVKNGSVCVSADDRVYDMKNGEIIFHKPLEFHKYHIEKNSYAELFIFSFSLTGTLAEFFENKVFSLNAKQKEIINSWISFINDKVSAYPCENLDVTGPLYILNKSELHMHIVLNYVYSFLLSLCDNNVNITTEATSEKAQIYKLAVKYMNDNISSSLTIKEIAEKCCISPTGLKKTFMEYTGLGVHKYFLKLKMKYASGYLSGGATTSEIAEALDFSSQAYFSEAFKREMGMSPKEYKRVCTEINYPKAMDATKNN